MAGVGVGCFGSGAAIIIKLKSMLRTTTKLSTQKMICRPLLCERLTFSSSNIILPSTHVSQDETL
jgi:hypothetical protein